MGYHFLPRWLCVFGLIPRWGNSSSNRWFIILSILWKKRFESGTYSEELQGLTSCTHTVFALLEGSIEKNCFKMQRVLLLLLYGTKSRENNWPNGQPGQCMTPSEFYKKNRYIHNWILCLCFCCGSTICHWWRFCLFAVNILNFSRPRLIKFSKIRKQLLLLLRLRVRQGRCCVDLL